MKYVYRETSKDYILISDKTFKINMYAEENQDHLYNEVLKYILENETIFTLKDDDIESINKFINTSRHNCHLDIRNYLNRKRGKTMASKTKKNNTKQILKVDLAPINNETIETVMFPDYKQVKKCYSCGHKEYVIKQYTYGYSLKVFDFEGKEKDIHNSLQNEYSKRIYCNKCAVCLGTLNKNIFLDVNTNQLFINQE